MQRFLGIPYATAERFGPPVLLPFSRGAGGHGPVAPQPPSRLRSALGDFDRPQGEDCLTLTIATPGIEGRRPVMVFLHGGAYWTGGGSLDWYDGGVLAGENGVVVVGVNYRLGALGFLAHPEVSPGNLGIADMVAALHWVRAHVGEFGGDPEAVTVVGQSAGAHAIMWLLAHPEGEGLFRRAVLMSAPPAMVPQSRARAAEYAEFMAAGLGVPVGRLRDAPATVLVEAGVQLARATARFADIAPPFMPVSDTLSDTAPFLAAAASGAVSRGVALVIGTTREEMHAFFAADPAMAAPSAAETEAKFAELAGDPAAMGLYQWRRPGGATWELLGDLVTDYVFLFPSLALADAVTRAGGACFAYQFDWSAPGSRLRACHCIDLPFLFGNPAAWAAAPMLAGGDITGLSAAFRACIAGFVTAGDPSTAGLPWAGYRPGSRTTMVFGEVTGPAGDPAGVGWRAGFDG